MFQASSCPSSGATTTAVAASGLPYDRGDSSVVGRGRAGFPYISPVSRTADPGPEIYIRASISIPNSCPSLEWYKTVRAMRHCTATDLPVFWLK